MDVPIQINDRTPAARRRRCLGTAAALGLLTLTGCVGDQSALDPAGPQAQRILDLGYTFTMVCGVVYGAFLIVLIIAIIRCRQKGSGAANLFINKPKDNERRPAIIVGVLTILSACLLSGLLLADLDTIEELQSLKDPEPLKITVTGRQWWWEIRYDDDVPSRSVTSANEIYLPVGRPVRFELKSPDVIHSFWIPNLHGKRDMIPGHPTSLWLQVDKPGIYYGQCAEFCGMQHALMRFVVVAVPPEEFDTWLDNQRRPAVEPETDQQRRGQQIFLSTTCIMCHTIRGTGSHASVGPDLTHLASRKTIAAGVLPNNRGHLGGWITDPQQIKAGARMPQHTYPAEDLRDLLAYLEILQ